VTNASVVPLVPLLPELSDEFLDILVFAIVMTCNPCNAVQHLRNAVSSSTEPETRRNETQLPDQGNIDSAGMSDDFFAKAIRLNVSAELILIIEYGSCFFVNQSTDEVAARKSRTSR
jgi:hypothetical protein